MSRALLLLFVMASALLGGAQAANELGGVARSTSPFTVEQRLAQLGITATTCEAVRVGAATRSSRVVPSSKTLWQLLRYSEPDSPEVQRDFIEAEFQAIDGKGKPRTAVLRVDRRDFARVAGDDVMWLRFYCPGLYYYLKTGRLAPRRRSAAVATSERVAARPVPPGFEPPPATQTEPARPFRPQNRLPYALPQELKTRPGPAAPSTTQIR